MCPLSWHILSNQYSCCAPNNPKILADKNMSWLGLTLAVALIDVSSRTQKVRSRVTISGDFHTSYTYLATLLSTGISISDDSDRENVGGDHPGFSFIESFSYFPVSCVGCWWYKESLTLTLHIYVSNTRVCVWAQASSALGITIPAMGS